MADREKLIHVFMHMGDHIRSLDEYGFGYDSILAEAIEDVVEMLKKPGTNRVTFATDNNVGSKWIPVSERLPKLESYTYSVDVLFSEYEEGIHVGYVDLKTGVWKDKYSRDIYADYKVTHWMPLPEPPKENN